MSKSSYTRNPGGGLTRPGEKQGFARYMAILIVGAMLVLSLFALAVITFESRAMVEDYQDMADLFEAQILTAETAELLGESPAGPAGYATFITLYEGDARTLVYHGTGTTPEAAWRAANKAARAGIIATAIAPTALRADMVCFSEPVSEAALQADLDPAQEAPFGYGLALDAAFETAFLQDELNGNDLYDPALNSLKIRALNAYLEAAGKEPLTALPGDYVRFSCLGWHCDAAGNVTPALAAARA